jgi:hypothetical protein
VKCDTLGTRGVITTVMNGQETPFVHGTRVGHVVFKYNTPLRSGDRHKCF